MTNLLKSVTVGVFVIVSVAVLVHATGSRVAYRSSRWAAAAFVSFTVVVVAGLLLPASADVPQIAQRLLLVMLILFPWLLFRFASGFRAPSRWLHVTASVTTAALTGAALLLPGLGTKEQSRLDSPLFVAFAWVFIAQWVTLLAWVGTQLWRASNDESPASRLRMRMMSVGAVTLALALLISGLASRTPASWVSLVTQALALLSGLLFYRGLVPSRWLQRLVRRPGDATWEGAMRGIADARDLPGLWAAVLPAAVSLAGGRAGVILAADGRRLLTFGAVPGSGREPGAGPGLRSAEQHTDEPMASVPVGGETLKVWAGPSALYFADDERRRLTALGVVAGLAAQRLQLGEEQLHRVTQAMRDSRTLSDSILEAAGEAILTFDAHGIVTTLNPAGERLFGERQAGLAGRDVRDLVPQLAEAGVIADGSHRFEAHARSIDGKVIPIEVTLTRIDLDLPLHLCVIRDVSEGHRMTVELQNVGARLHAIVTTAVDGILCIDEHGVIESLNPAVERLFGYSAEELLGRNVSVLMPEPVRQEHDGYLYRYLTTGERRVIGIGREVMGRRKDGSQLPLDLAVSEMQVDGRRMFTGIVRDITERKHAEQVLQDSAARLAAIVETAVDGIISIDEHGRIDSVNLATERLFGYPAEELLGQNVSVLMPSPTRQEHDGYLRAYLGTGERKVIGIGREVVGRHKDGSAVHLDLAVNEMRVGGRRMFTGIVRDITERKRAERAIRERAEALSRSNAELQQFAYVASHDLQEPLRKIASYVQVLATDYADALDEQAREYIGFAVDGAQRMRHLIDDLLAVSRLRVDAMRVDECDCAALVDTILEDLSLAIRESGARVEVGYLPIVRADPAHLRQVFQNLVSNALKYRRDVPLELRISSRQEDGNWWFTVSDNGIGFKQEYGEKIFGMFQRLVSRRQYEGTGMGLAIVAKVVENHGGRITVRSEPGVGSTFEFCLPNAAQPVLSAVG